METDNYKEIKDIAPNLAKIKKENPFLVPDNYFSELEGKIFSKLIDDVEPKQIVPEEYFANLTSKIMTEVNDKHDIKIIHFNYKKWIPVAASVILVLSAGLWFSSNNLSESSEFSFATDMEASEIMEYLLIEDELYLIDLLDADMVDASLFEEETTLEMLDDMDLDNLLEGINDDALEGLF